jgi:hypothetical protein
MPAHTHWRIHEVDEDDEVQGTAAAPPVTDPSWVAWIERQAAAAQRAAASPVALPEPPVDPPQEDEQSVVPQVEPEPEPEPQPRTHPTVPPELDRDRRHGRLVVVGIAAALVCLVCLVSLGTWRWVGGEAGNTDHGSADAGTAGRADGSASATGTASSPGTSPTTAAPQPPFALTADEEHSRIRVLPGGDLEVQQWVHRGEELLQLRLAPPDGIEVSALSVVAGGRPVVAPADLTRPTRLDFTSTPDVFLTYRLSGALEADGQRALARATSIDLGLPALVDAWTIEFQGGSILSLACTTADAEVPQPCGADAGAQGWRVVPPAGAIPLVVMAQVDLDPTS